MGTFFYDQDMWWQKYQTESSDHAQSHMTVSAAGVGYVENKCIIMIHALF